jgi:hypothetical protein
MVKVQNHMKVRAQAPQEARVQVPSFHQGRQFLRTPSPVQHSKLSNHLINLSRLQLNQVNKSLPNKVFNLFKNKGFLSMIEKSLLGTKFLIPSKLPLMKKRSMTELSTTVQP